MPKSLLAPLACALALGAGCASDPSASPAAPGSSSSSSVALQAAQGRSNPAPQGTPPRARVLPRELVAHGETRVDDYYWMRERSNPEVLAYLEAENAYADLNLVPTAETQETLFQEFKARVQETDVTVPVRSGPFEYYTRTKTGQAYPVHCRRPARPLAASSIPPGADADETVLFDVNVLSQGNGFFSLGQRVPSHDHSHIAYAVDRVGRRIWDLEIKNVDRGDISRGISGTSGSFEWSGAGDYLFYVKRDPVTLRACQVWRHRLNTPPRMDELVYEETDETFSCYLETSRSKEWLKIVSSHSLTTEVRLLKANDPLGDWQVVLPRETGHEYSVEPAGDRLYFRTNKDAENFKLVIAPLEAPTQWTDVLRHRAGTLLVDFDVFATHVVAKERRAGLAHLVVHPTTMDAGFQSFEIPFSDPTYTVSVRGNDEFNSRRVRYVYSSLTTPRSTIELDLDSQESTVLKEAHVGGGFDSANYESKRLFAEASDGTFVPISIVARKDRGDAPGPLLLYGYGSYGSSQEAGFRANAVSLLDRGFAYAIAHVRGGQELGRAWYDYGKLEHKMNTFTDFIACAEHLVAEGLTEPGQLYAQGGSAGGLLMGAVANMRPDLFHGILAAVPFVDVVTTMLDETIPLTTFEYDEWGNPNEEAAYRTMLEYSPYDQVAEQPYPNMLVTTGFHDSQVQYWEPAKWVAKLRAKMAGDSVLLFDCEMEAGHGGVSGRYSRMRKTAQSYAFLLWLQLPGNDLSRGANGATHGGE